MQLAEYLEAVGLSFNPFDGLEASADSRLISYLIDNEAFEKIWQSKGDYNLGGESGSGRTAIAERMAYECRTASDGKHIFPVILGESNLLAGDMKRSFYAAAGLGVLLEAVYHLEKFDRQSPAERLEMINAIETAAPGAINHLLPQVVQKESLKPLSDLIDSSSSMLPNQPSANKIRQLANQIMDLNKSEAGKSVPSIFDIITGPFGLSEIKLIADFSHGPSRDDLMELDRVGDVLSGKTNVLKVVMAPSGENLQSPMILDWSSKQLEKILETRIGVASGGKLGSLDVLSDPSFVNVESKIVEAAVEHGKTTPRAVISLANRLLFEGALDSGSIIRQIDGKTFRKAVEKEFGKLS